ncbi:MAG: glycosyltransferase family 39 protein [Cyanobacteria bacterium Co-bin13]|nr:glycosyltransferase family 39 protein [Cyanobacteria bacterium Co-bin13]
MPLLKSGSLLQSGVLRWGAPFLGGLLLLRLIFWGSTFPNPDEAYYWLWGQRPEFSYYDHPPFHAWMQGLFAAIFGRSRLALRLPNLVSNGLLLFTYFQICRYLYRDRAVNAFWVLVLLLASSPLFFLFLALAWHDHWLVTFSVMGSFAFVRFIDGYLVDGQGEGRWLYGAAFCLGLAGLCKYNAVFVGLGFLAVIVVDRRLRSLLLDPRLYGAIAIALLTLSPILIWNWQNDFFSFRFYADRTGGRGDLRINWLQPLVFWLLCGLILGPVHAWSIGRWMQQRLSVKEKTPTADSVYGSVALAIFLVSTGAFTALSLVSVAYYYWNILAYPLLFPLVAGQFLPVAAAPASPPRQKSLLLSAQLIGITVAGTLIFHYTVVPLTALISGVVDPDSAALYGWDAIAAQVQTQAQTLENPLLLTTDYRSAGALAYQLNTPEVMAISGRLDQFDFWYDQGAMQGRDAVLLGENWHPICPTHLAMFERTDSPEQIEVKRLGVTLQTYTLVRAYGFQAGPDDRYPLQPDYPLAFTSDGEICAPN